MTTIPGTPGSHPLDGSRASRPLGYVPVGTVLHYRKTATIIAAPLTEDVDVATPEGVMSARAGDYLAQHEDGHAWPIKRETFESTYEAIE